MDLESDIARLKTRRAPERNRLRKELDLLRWSIEDVIEFLISRGCMEREIKMDGIDRFMAEMKRLGIEKIAFCETDERRAVQEEPGKLSVLPVVRLELLAYRDAMLYKCVSDNVNLDEIYDLLVSRGFDVTRSTRNIT